MYEQALAGELIGLAVVARLPDKRFFVDVFGDGRYDPVTTRGMTAGLDDMLRELAACMHDT